MTYRESTIRHYGLGIFDIHVLLVRGTGTESLLAEHISKCGGIVISVVPDYLSSLRVPSFDLNEVSDQCLPTTRN